MQLIIVYIIIALSVAYAIYGIVKYVRRKKDPCDGCAGCEIKSEITKNLKNKTTKNPSTCNLNPENSKS